MKTFLKKTTVQISLKKILWLKHLYDINDFNDEEVIEEFYKKEFISKGI